MIIQWYGQACFKITGQSQDVNLLIDPLDPSCGLKLPKVHPDLLLVSTQKLASANDASFKSSESQPFLITHEGEYEVKGAFIYAVKVDSTHLFSIGLDDLFVVHAGTLKRTLTEHEIDQLGRVDILILPIGGGEVLDAKRACEVILQLEPRIVIPMQYKIPGLKGEYATLETFCKEYGVKDCEKNDKLKISKKDLPLEETEIMCLSIC